MMIQFEEEDDEGACYAFQLDEQRVVFLVGQDYYPSAKFPNTNFSLARIYAEDGSLVEEFIEKAGRKLQPLRTVSAEARSKMRAPDNLEVISTDLHKLEECLTVHT
jgi:hypothetical protein